MDQQLDMEYNSEREELIIPEYGRNVQKLINHAKTIEDSKMRQAFVESVIDLMQQMHPQSRNMEDYRDKLWRHVFRIANYELEVDPPTGPRPTSADLYKKPDIIPYPEFGAKYRHYGNNVQQLIKKAIAMEDGPKKEGFVATIGSYMKLAYRTWNKEHYVSDDVIKNDLETLSGGKLSLGDEAAIENLMNTPPPHQNRGGSGRRRNGQSNGRGGSQKNRNRNRRKK